MRDDKDLFPDLDPTSDPPADADPSILLPEDAIEGELFDNPGLALQLAKNAIENDPSNGVFLILAAMAAVLQGDPRTAHRYLKRLDKKFMPSPVTPVVRAIALAQENRWPVAQQLLRKHQIVATSACYLLPRNMTAWARRWLKKIERWTPEAREKSPRKERTRPTQRAKQTEKVAAPQAAVVPAPLPRFSPLVTLNITLPTTTDLTHLEERNETRIEDFLLKHDLSRLSLFRGFDELLCIPQLHGVEHYWYQVETVRKVLKQFRGRVLLADEVGLGKTIEAGMILKEYILRGMADRALILAPPSLVGQWREEMETKFGVVFHTTQSSLLRKDPAAFWSQAHIIASIATARLPRHMKHLARHTFDIVVVDEAHHLKNRSTRNWKLVDALKKRFLLLLSATPVQNGLIEIYNLLTLLKPGLFTTEKGFRTAYVKPRHPRVPINRERLQDLMRDVMIRNTRALVDVRLPPRQVITLRVDPSPEEADAYQSLGLLIREMREDQAVHHRLALHHILQAAGSSPAAATASIHRFCAQDVPPAWQDIHAGYAALTGTAKVSALLELLERNPNEKKLIFVRFRETLKMLGEIFDDRGLAFARFEGTMTGPQKDRSVERFRDEVDILLCTESGGEGRNLQFCNTLINFDLHWNPQRIEQRIGRIHRIGQEREVFVFNLAVRRTIEDRILSILDEKINMFELVVGEVQSILGEMEDRHGFAELVFGAWLQRTEQSRHAAFEDIGNKLMVARRHHESVKAYDNELFGEEFEAV